MMEIDTLFRLNQKLLCLSFYIAHLIYFSVAIAVTNHTIASTIIIIAMSSCCVVSMIGLFLIVYIKRMHEYIYFMWLLELLTTFMISGVMGGVLFVDGITILLNYTPKIIHVFILHEFMYGCFITLLFGVFIIVMACFIIGITTISIYDCIYDCIYTEQSIV